MTDAAFIWGSFADAADPETALRKPAIMAPLLFSCPNTHRRALTGIETAAKSLRASWKRMLKIKCPHCGEVHKISVRDTYIDFAVRDPTDRIVLDRLPSPRT
jgi:phenylpropionate dioxygenase-like ring-hydroxylating dioxygenase large terminal subunit